MRIVTFEVIGLFIYIAATSDKEIVKSISEKTEKIFDENLSDKNSSDESLSDESLSDESLSDESLSDESLSDNNLFGENFFDKDIFDKDIFDKDLIAGIGENIMKSGEDGIKIDEDIAERINKKEKIYY